MFEHPGLVVDNWDLSQLPENYNSLDESVKAKVDSARRSEACHKHYLGGIQNRNPRHWATLLSENAEVRTEPSRLFVNVMGGSRYLFFFGGHCSQSSNSGRTCVRSLGTVL